MQGVGAALQGHVDTLIDDVKRAIGAPVDSHGGGHGTGSSRLGFADVPGSSSTSGAGFGGESTSGTGGSTSGSGGSYGGSTTGGSYGGSSTGGGSTAGQGGAGGSGAYGTSPGTSDGGNASYRAD
jgi:hypothetical protein